MTQIQKYMVRNSNGFEIYFFDHSFKTARQHAEDYIKRNKEGELYRANYSSYGNRWIKEAVND